MSVADFVGAKATCSKCGKIWRISVQAVVDEHYVCPHCYCENKKNRRIDSGERFETAQNWSRL